MSVTLAGDWHPWLATTSIAPEYWATCGHVHPWGLACSFKSTSSATQFDRKFGPCPKCDSHDLLVQYHDGKRPKGFTFSPSCRHSDECGRDGKRGQHLRVHCRRCQFGWREQPGRGFDQGPPK